MGTSRVSQQIGLENILQWEPLCKHRVKFKRPAPIALSEQYLQMHRPFTAWKLEEAEWNVSSLFYCFLAPKSRFDFVSFLIVENTHLVPSVLLLRLKKKDQHLLGLKTFLIYFKKDFKHVLLCLHIYISYCDCSCQTLRVCCYPMLKNHCTGLYLWLPMPTAIVRHGPMVPKC